MTLWHENGQKRLEWFHDNDIATGVWKQWDANGALICSGEFKKGKPWAGTFPQGNCEQEWLVRYENGDKVSQVPWHGAFPDGFYEDGKLVKKAADP